MLGSSCSLDAPGQPDARGFSANQSASPSVGDDIGVQISARSAVVLTDNDDAFAQKIKLIRGAKDTIDAAYFIYSNDESSSLFSKELVAAARRGVNVRLLIDLGNTYRYLDHFSGMELAAAGGRGRLAIRFFNRPTRNMVRDSAYVSLACSKGTLKKCGEWKKAEIARRFPAGIVSLLPFIGLPKPDYSGDSGLLLSALYAQNIDLAAFAIAQGRSINTAGTGNNKARITKDNVVKIAKLGKLYWQAKAGSGFQRILARIKLSIARAVFGDVINPIFDVISAFLPVDTPDLRGSARDWRHSGDYLHHKLLLVDERRMIIGGRNVENSYHMRPNTFTRKKPVFRDTELMMNLSGDSGAKIRARFERVWSFRELTATTDEVRSTVPNDVVANYKAFKTARAICARRTKVRRSACIEARLARSALPASTRIRNSVKNMSRRAARYRAAYKRRSYRANSRVNVDAGASFYYLENLPFVNGANSLVTRRSYLPRSGKEIATGKGIHAYLARALDHACHIATPARPRRIILYNAYVLLPSALFARLGKMLTGQIHCKNVTVTIITNSRETFDIDAVGQTSSHVFAALNDHIAANRDPKRAARFEYYEFRRPPGTPLITLHSKVWLFGDEIFIGSANADLRTFMLDTQNGVLIRNAPRLITRYTALIKRLVANRVIITNKTRAYTSATRQRIFAADLAKLRRGLAKASSASRLSKGRAKLVEKHFRRMTDAAYSLSLSILRGGPDAREAGDKFDRTFRLI